MSDEPLDHVLRPVPPWRDQLVTECGRPTNDLASVLTRSDFIAKVARLGKQRSSMTTCMTCWETSTRHADWAKSPSEVIARDVHGYAMRKTETVLDRELRAIAHLVDNHREEFDGLLDGLGRVDDLADARKRRMGRRA